MEEDIRTIQLRLGRASFAFAEMTKRLDALEKKVEEYRTLLVDLRGEDAVSFHESFGKEKSDKITI
jgi:hypothetical protein